MNSTVVRIDRKGRFVIPKKLREELNISEGGYVELRIEEGKLVITPLKPAAERYFGVFKAKKWPEDLDEFLKQEVNKKWSEDT